MDFDARLDAEAAQAMRALTRRANDPVAGTVVIVLEARGSRAGRPPLFLAGECGVGDTMGGAILKAVQDEEAEADAED